MSDKYFQTKSKVFAYAIQFVTNRRFYVFEDESDVKTYSFQADEWFYDKIRKLEKLKFEI